MNKTCRNVGSGKDEDSSLGNGTYKKDGMRNDHKSRSFKQEGEKSHSLDL